MRYWILPRDSQRVLLGDELARLILFV